MTFNNVKVKLPCYHSNSTFTCNKWMECVEFWAINLYESYCHMTFWSFSRNKQKERSPKNLQDFQQQCLVTVTLGQLFHNNTNIISDLSPIHLYKWCHIFTIFFLEKLPIFILETYNTHCTLGRTRWYFLAKSTPTRPCFKLSCQSNAEHRIRKYISLCYVN